MPGRKTGGSGPRLLVSIHDLMPSTMPDVMETIAFLRRLQVRPVTLLVVPGTGWDAEGIATLRQLQDDGYELAGHGWTHHVPVIRGWRHRLHSTFISRNVAEHLALDEAGIRELVARNYTWFGDHGLDAPSLYVPPAWAMGAIRPGALRELPYARYEVLTGVYDAERDRFQRVPVTGYEADQPGRVLPLRLWNRLNERLGRRQGLLRVGIHPHDLRYPMRGDLERLLTAGAPTIGYGELARA